MRKNRDCTLVRSIPKSIAEALNDANTIEQLIRDNCFKPVEENDAVRNRIAELRMNLFNNSSINSHIYSEIIAPLYGDPNNTIVKIEVVLIDRNLVFPFETN